MRVNYLLNTQPINLRILGFKNMVQRDIDNILNNVQKRIEAFGPYNQPSQSQQDNMYKEAFGFPGAANVSEAEQMYYDTNVKIKLGFPAAIDVNTAETLYTEQEQKNTLGFPDAISVVAAEASAKDFQTRKDLGYPQAIDASAAEALYLEDGLKLSLGYPNAVDLSTAETLYLDNRLKKELNYPEVSSVSEAQMEYVNQGLRLALGFPRSSLSISEITVLCFNKEYRTLFGYPLAESNEVAEKLWFDNRMKELIVHPPIPQSAIDQLLKDAFGFPGAANVSEAEFDYYDQRVKVLFQQKDALRLSSNINRNPETSMNIAVQTITHDERVYGRATPATSTLRSAMAIAPMRGAGLTREQRLVKSQSYTTLYRQAEAFVKNKVIKDAASGIQYTPKEVQDMVYAQLRRIPSRVRPKQKPTLPPPPGPSFGEINRGKKKTVTHKERVRNNQKLSVVSKEINLIVKEIENQTGQPITPEERNRLQDRYWRSIVRENWKIAESMNPTPPPDITSDDEIPYGEIKESEQIKRVIDDSELTIKVINARVAAIKAYKELLDNVITPHDFKPIMDKAVTLTKELYTSTGICLEPPLAGAFNLDEQKNEPGVNPPRKTRFK